MSLQRLTTYWDDLVPESAGLVLEPWYMGASLAAGSAGLGLDPGLMERGAARTLFFALAVFFYD